MTLAEARQALQRRVVESRARGLHHQNDECCHCRRRLAKSSNNAPADSEQQRKLASSVLPEVEPEEVPKQQTTTASGITGFFNYLLDSTGDRKEYASMNVSTWCVHHVSPSPMLSLLSPPAPLSHPPPPPPTYTYTAHRHHHASISLTARSVGGAFCWWGFACRRDRYKARTRSKSFCVCCLIPGIETPHGWNV